LFQSGARLSNETGIGGTDQAPQQINPFALRQHFVVHELQSGEEIVRQRRHTFTEPGAVATALNLMNDPMNSRSTTTMELAGMAQLH